MSVPRLAGVFSILVSVLAAEAARADAGSDAVKVYRKSLGKVVAEQRSYLSKRLDEELRDAYDTYRAPWRERGGPDAPKVIDYDFAGYEAVYERFADLDREKGQLALALAGVDGEAVAERLVETLVEVSAEIAALDEEILKSRPKGGSVHDQTPAIRRYGAWAHREALVAAIGKLRAPDALAWLADDGFGKAARVDRSKRTDLARIALVDALAGIGGEAVTPVLLAAAESEEPRMRIAGLEAVAAMDRARVEKAAEEDPCRAVRVAARALLGDAAAPAAAPPADDPLFFGIAVPDRVLFLLDASYQTVKPADVERMKERSWREWRSVAEKDRDYVTQLELMKRETRAVVNRLPEGARFDILLFGPGDAVTPCGPREPLEVTAAARRRAGAFLDDASPDGWAPQIEALWAASRRAGVEPYSTELPEGPDATSPAEAICLASSGVPAGGPIMHAPAIVEDVRRRHRFLRIPIHTVRIDDSAAPAEELMKGIAEATGGTYVHRTTP